MLIYLWRLGYTMGRGQAGMEYMLVVGFSLLMIIPVVAIFGREKQSVSDQVNDKQASAIARNIADTAETVFYLGKPTKTTLKVYMPHSVEDVVIGRNYISIILEKDGTLVEVPPAYSAVNLSGNISVKPGIQYIVIAADDTQVNITG
jgi:uncharacterized protein (UPF0333 family)